ncbi:hypothetical protein NPIL_366011 [Nephila pilipes]|uniref:Uncharacterized protein n=1 Tax=Nephila pilipes TaxID=299642 RepID=A0A8X6UDW3_NEPPI|nr:hypothetical protein NPIL_366011 [Nephila pilipes]
MAGTEHFRRDIRSTLPPSPPEEYSSPRKQSGLLSREDMNPSHVLPELGWLSSGLDLSKRSRPEEIDLIIVEDK